jgi:hypothetical protein
LLWFVFSVILGAWTLFFQAYIYSEPTPDLWWRAPAAGTALLLFLLLWVVLDYRTIDRNETIGRYRELQQFSFIKDEDPPKELIIVRNNKEEKFQLHRSPEGRREYRNGAVRLPSRPDAVIIVEGDQRYVFQPDRDAKGKFKPGPDDMLHYHDERGREMVEGFLGFVSTRQYGWLLGNLLLNFLHLVVWFLGLWLLLRYQWPHALGLAVVFWAVTTLFVLPMVLGFAERVAHERVAPPPTEVRADQRQAA